MNLKNTGIGNKLGGDTEEEFLPSLLPNRVAKPYQKCGWFLFVFLMTLFLAGSITVIALKYNSRKEPQISLDLKKEKNMKFPEKLMICPESQGLVSWHYVELIDSFRTKINSENLAVIEVHYADQLDMDCLLISIDAQIIRAPAALEFAVVWSQPIDAYSDLLLAFDENFTSSAYMASGFYNSSRGVSNNVDLALERYTYLPSSTPEISERWTANTATTDYFYYTISENATEIVCSPDQGKYTEECTTRMNLCPGDEFQYKDKGKKCTMMSVFYLSINSNLVSVFSEVDPVDWKEIIASIGGYWVYVGAGFSLFFSVKKGTLELIPMEGLRKLLNSWFSKVKSRVTMCQPAEKEMNLSPSKDYHAVFLSDSSSTTREYQTVFLKASH
jgi:hypothetical protein